MKWKSVNGSKTKLCEELVFGKCPVTGEDVCVTSIFSRRQICETDLQKTPIYSGYTCSLYEKSDTKFSKCIECPLIRKEKL